MRLSVRWSPLVILAAALVVSACSDDSSGPDTLPADRLIGEYSCTVARATFTNALTAPDDGPGTYQLSPCSVYTNFTSPNRRDSIETYEFSIDDDSLVSRLDFPFGTASYSEETGILTITTPGYPVETYSVGGTARDVVLSRTLTFDFDGDGIDDSVQLTFLQQ